MIFPINRMIASTAQRPVQRAFWPRQRRMTAWAGALLLGTALLALSAKPLAAQSSGVYRQAKIAFSARNYDRAYSLFQQAAQANPNDGNPLFYVGYILDQKGRRGAAVGAYQRAVSRRIDRDLREKAFWKIVLYYKHIRDWENLYVYSERFLKFNRGAGVRKLHALADQNRDPRLAEAKRLVREAEQLQKKKDTEGAAQTYARALESKSDYHPARWQLALLRMQQKNYKSAEKELRQLIQSDENRWEYYYKAGICNLQMDRHDAALSDMQQARAKNEKPSKSFLYFVNLAEGLVHLEREDFDTARSRLTDAAKVRQTPRLQGALARAQWATGSHKAAEKTAHEALKKEPEQSDARLVKTLSAIRARRSKEAFAESKALLVREEAEQSRTKERGAFASRFTPVLLYLGRQATEREDWLLAIRAYERVDMKRLQRMYDTERNTSTGKRTNSLREYNYHYGVALFHAERNRQAIVTLKRVDSSPAARYLIARAYSRDGKSQNARTYLKQAAERKPVYWLKALNESDFTGLMQRDSDFDFFVRNRGREPEPEPVKPAAEGEKEGGATTKPHSASDRTTSTKEWQQRNNAITNP